MILTKKKKTFTVCWQIIKYFRLSTQNLNTQIHPFRGCLSLFWCHGRQNAFLYPLNFENWLYHVVLNGDCLPPFTAQFKFCWHRVAFMHSNDDSFFLSWLNATTVSINMFLCAPAACQVWRGMPLTQLFSSRPIHSWNVIYVSHTVSWRVYWEHFKSRQLFITER